MDYDNKDTIYIYLINLVLASAVILVILFVAVFLVTRSAINPIFEYTNTGTVGDTFGGITAPFIGSIGIVLTFLAFYIQYKANEMQFAQFKLQAKEREIDKHENKILYLIKQNRSIVDGINFGNGINGVDCFNSLFYEFEFAYDTLLKIYKDEVGNDELANMAYLIVHNGACWPDSTLNEVLLSKMPRLENTLKLFQKLSEGGPIISSEIGLSYSDYQDIKRTLGYIPFRGHMTELGHYFRNLFHLLNYTTSVPDELMSDTDKYELIKTLRTQMSVYEQIAIYFNSLSDYGKPLRDKEFIEKYCLVKNIPIPSVAFVGDIQERFPNIEFEWNEILGDNLANPSP